VGRETKPEQFAADVFGSPNMWERIKDMHGLPNLKRLESAEELLSYLLPGGNSLD
jgi:hypothetical protein